MGPFAGIKTINFCKGWSLWYNRLKLKGGFTMPIPGEQFDKGLDNTKFQMLEFLKKDPNNAYTPLEIMHGIGLSTKTNNFGEGVILVLGLMGYDSMLRDMAKAGVIKEKTINGQSYYKVVKA
jgi:hypothetical protein